MSGLRITIPTSFTDETLPVLRTDTLLPDTGALLLVDPAHPVTGPLTLASGMVLPNIAAPQAAALIGVSQSAVGAQLSYTGISTSGTTKGQVERSGKGGIHTILSASTTLASGDGLVVRPDQALVDYVVAHPNNDYYISLWLRPTRYTGATMAYSSVSLSVSESGSQLLYALESNAAILPTGANKIGGISNPATHSASAPAFMSMAVSAYTGTPEKTGTAARDFFKVWGVGNHRPFFNLTAGNPSAILYRAYIEDLTVSGRTYAQVSALDFDLYTQEVLESGGRYYGDTFTNPETIP